MLSNLRARERENVNPDEIPTLDSVPIDFAQSIWVQTGVLPVSPSGTNLDHAILNGSMFWGDYGAFLREQTHALADVIELGDR